MKWINWLLLIVVSILSLTCIKQCNVHQMDQELMESLNDSVVRFKDKLGVDHVKITSLQSSNLDLVTRLETSNETVKELQNLIKSSKKKHIETATVIKTITKLDTILVSEPAKDPTFRLKDKYVDFFAQYTDKGLESKISFTSYLKLLYHYERKNLFSRKYLVVEAVDDNPYLTVEDVRSIRVPMKSRRFGIGPFIGLDYRLNPTFGIGLTYTVISF